MLTNNVLLIHLPALRSLDLGMDYYGTSWSISNAIVPLTYLRVYLGSMDTLLHLMSTQPLSKTLRQLHIQINNIRTYNHRRVLLSDVSMRMINLHTFTLMQKFFSMLRIEWTAVEMLTSSNVMPVLRRANISLFINTNDLNCISSSPLFTDHRHVDVHFAFNLINCPQYTQVTQYIPRGHRSHPRAIVGATFLINHWSNRSEWIPNGDPFVSFFSIRLLKNLVPINQNVNVFFCILERWTSILSSYVVYSSMGI